MAVGLGGEFCGDQCTDLMELTVWMPGDWALILFPWLDSKGPTGETCLSGCRHCPLIH